MLLGAFKKFRKATITFVMSLRLSVRMKQLDSQWTDFHEILYLIVFKKMCQNSVSLKSDPNKRHFT